MHSSYKQIFIKNYYNNTTIESFNYLVIKNREYSKHYYIEGQRICSKLGGGLANSIIDFESELQPIKYDYSQIKRDLYFRISNNTECVTMNPENFSLLRELNSLEELHYADNSERDLYFYHSDHLGSSSFITDADGITTQHLQYLPYGELFVEQRSTANYFTPYKFSAKEKDEETSYSYFGARYLASDFSFWLSVDPMSDERSWLSPYNYCQWNPVRLIDPKGMLDTDFGVKSNGEVKQIGPTNNEPDRLFAINDDDTKKNVNPVTINDKNILPELSFNCGYGSMYKGLSKKQNSWYQSRKSYLYQKLRYSESGSKEDMSTVFKFTSDNSDVEWGLNSYNIGGQSKYVIGTSQSPVSAPDFERLNSNYSFNNLTSSFHSHPNGSLFGASGYDNDGGNDLTRLQMAKPNTPHYFYNVSNHSIYQYNNKSNGIYKGNSSVSNFMKLLK